MIKGTQEQSETFVQIKEKYGERVFRHKDLAEWRQSIGVKNQIQQIQEHNLLNEFYEVGIPIQSEENNCQTVM